MHVFSSSFLVLSEVDEETAESTTWRASSGGTWNFESKLLSVTWLTKSQNIYFDGEKGNDLTECILETKGEFLRQRQCPELEVEKSIDKSLEGLTCQL